MRNLKITILANGHAAPTNRRNPRGYAGGNPVIEITDIPDNVTDVEAISAYDRCVIMPVMHATMPIPWPRIAESHQGQIIHLTRGRPAKGDAKFVRVNITLSPETLALIDAQPEARSKLIERLIIKAFG
ncbi:hypothetical protein [Novosphingobium sp. FKTRR1]|uniref:hypothetical protein n=1 Tax=Novosphingobium sp. FKTRR1 TaxID=2879118 RepID=UPI001CF03C67|nr:hypothetical protein [Novosphingobium sp. FKTRR1]